MEGILSQRTTPRAISAAAVFAVLITLVTVIVAPNAARPVGAIVPFLPMFAMAVFLTENLTAFFLYSQFRSTREPFLAALAGAYGYVATLVAVQLLVFPGVFSATGLFNPGPLSPVWLWLAWHIGFPMLVLLALPLYAPDGGRLAPTVRKCCGVGLMIGGPLLAFAIAVLVIRHGAALPALVGPAPAAVLARRLIGGTLIAVTVLTLLLCLRVTRLRDMLTLWLAIAMLASLADAVLTLAAVERYCLGWYVSRLLSMLSSTVVLGVLVWEISQLYRRLERAHRSLAERSIRDPLTGAFNRGYLIEQFPREFRRALRERGALSLLMIDVDYFKLYNDAHGHQQGDRCLVDIVAAIQSALHRPGDYVARYGGEEFAVVLPQTSEQGALRIAESIRAALAALRIPRAGFGPPYVTVSTGVATFDPTRERLNADELIRRADIALYAAKHAGRDRVRVHGREHVEPGSEPGAGPEAGPEAGDRADRAPAQAQVEAQTQARA